jgi:hypothetical protein
MPYIMTTKRPPAIPVMGSINEPKLAREGITVERGPDGIAIAFVSRHAVATLDDARFHIGIKMGGRVGRPVKVPKEFIEVLANLSESGGTVGPLPDGTLITVEWEEEA